MKQRSFWQWTRLCATWHFAVLFLLFAGLIGYVVMRSFVRQLRCQPVEATILTSRLEPCPDGMFSVDIRFAYTIERRRFTAGRYRDDFGKMCLKEAEAKAITSQYPQGQQVKAWYDPEHPKYAILDRSPGTFQVGYLIVMGGFALILLLAFLLNRKHRIRQDSGD